MIYKLFQKIQQLGRIPRYSGHLLNRVPSVSEHSFGVAALSFGLARLENKKRGPDEGKADLGIVYEGALFHDLPESFSGDILYPFKCRMEELNGSDKNLVREAERDFLEEWTEDGFLGDILEELHEKTTMDEDTLETRIIEAADYLELLSFIQSEIKLGNTSLWDMWYEGLKLIGEHREELHGIDKIYPILEHQWEEREVMDEDMVDAIGFGGEENDLS